MKKIYSLLLIAASPFIVFAQKKSTAAEKIGKTITAADLQKHLYIVAGPEMEGRNTPSAGLEKAATYIEDHFRSLGLMPGNNGSYRQYYPLYKDSVLATSFSVNGQSFAKQKDYAPLAMNYSGQMFFSEVVFAGYGIVEEGVRNDYKELNVVGKLVLITEGVPEGYKSKQTGRFAPTSFFSKIRAAQEKGAAAVIVVAEKLLPSGTGDGSYSLNRYVPTQLPLTFSVSTLVAETILGKSLKSALEKNDGATPATSTYKAKVDLEFLKAAKTVQVSNVLGVIEGTDKKDEYIIVTAHYDHEGKRNDGTIYYGADDDGSGTVAVLELAEAFATAKKEGNGPRRSIIFMTVSGEEKGLWGSAYYSDNPVFPLDKTSVNLNIDMIGRVGEDYIGKKDSASYVYVIGDDRLSTDLEPIMQFVNKTYTKIVLDRKYNGNDPNRFYFRSDHYNFAKRGVPAIFYFNGVHADYHKPTDTPDKINYKLLTKRAQLVFYTAWEIANRDEMVKRNLELKLPER